MYIVCVCVCCVCVCVCVCNTLKSSELRICMKLKLSSWCSPSTSFFHFRGGQSVHYVLSNSAPIQGDCR